MEKVPRFQNVPSWKNDQTKLSLKQKKQIQIRNNSMKFQVFGNGIWN